MAGCPPCTVPCSHLVALQGALGLKGSEGPPGPPGPAVSVLAPHKASPPLSSKPALQKGRSQGRGACSPALVVPRGSWEGCAGGGGLGMDVASVPEPPEHDEGPGVWTRPEWAPQACGGAQRGSRTGAARTGTRSSSPRARPSTRPRPLRAQVTQQRRGPGPQSRAVSLSGPSQP